MSFRPRRMKSYKLLVYCTPPNKGFISPFTAGNHFYCGRCSPVGNDLLPGRNHTIFVDEPGTSVNVFISSLRCVVFYLLIPHIWSRTSFAITLLSQFLPLIGTPVFDSRSTKVSFGLSWSHPLPFIWFSVLIWHGQWVIWVLLTEVILLLVEEFECYPSIC